MSNFHLLEYEYFVLKVSLDRPWDRYVICRYVIPWIEPIGPSCPYTFIHLHFTLPMIVRVSRWPCDAWWLFCKEGWVSACLLIGPTRKTHSAATSHIGAPEHPWKSQPHVFNSRVGLCESNAFTNFFPERKKHPSGFNYGSIGGSGWATLGK